MQKKLAKIEIGFKITQEIQEIGVNGNIYFQAFSKGKSSDEVLDEEQVEGEGGTTGKENKRMEEKNGQDGPENIQEDMPACQKEAIREKPKYPKEIEKSTNDNKKFEREHKSGEEGTVEKENKEKEEENRHADQERIKQEDIKELEVIGKLPDDKEEGDKGTWGKKGWADSQKKEEDPIKLKKYIEDKHKEDTEIDKENEKLKVICQSEN